MKSIKLACAFSLALSAGVTSNAVALDLYVDTESKQIFAEPGPGRVHLGSFVRAEDVPAKTETAKVRSAPLQTSVEPSKETESAELTPIRKEQTIEVVE